MARFVFYVVSLVGALAAWGIIFSAAFVEGFDERVIAQTIEFQSNPSTKFKFERDVHFKSRLSAVHILTLSSSVNWRDLSHKKHFPESLKIYLQSLRNARDLLPKGTRIFSSKKVSGSKDTVSISAVLPDLTVQSWQLGPSGFWTFSKLGKAEQRWVKFSGSVETNLRESANQEGLDPQLLQNMVKAFATEIDLYGNVKRGGQWRLIAQGLFARGYLIGWNPVAGAQIRASQRVHSAILYKTFGMPGTYYDLTGRSLGNRFLPHPLRYRYISSGFFSARFHPIQKSIRPHRGIDYSAPLGTPVMAIGDGTIVYAGTHSLSGHMIKISHGPLRESRYLHLSRFAKFVGLGSKVEAGQVIGYVGATGLATGPHLHFEFVLDGKVVNPHEKNIAKARLLPPKLLSDFEYHAQKILSLFPAWKDASDDEKPSREKIVIGLNRR